MSGGQWYLSMDRTNWRWGKSDINILMLGIVFKGTAIPIYWMLLDKRGNSDTPDRVALIQMFIDHFGKNCIKGVLADQEFVGKDWFGWGHLIYLAGLRLNGKYTLSSKTIPSGLILVSDYFDGWLPACAGMTGFLSCTEYRNTQ